MAAHRAPALRRTFSRLPPLVSIGIAIVAAVFFARGVRASSERLHATLDELRGELPLDRATSYRTQLVADFDPRAPWLLALAARAQAWLVVMGLVRLGSLPLELIDLVDEPHRRLGLVPADDRLVLVHVVLAGAVLAAGIGALGGRGWIARLDLGAPSRSELVQARALTRATALSAVGALAAGGTGAAVMAWTPMSLYWLHDMAAQSVVFAVCASLAAAATVLASRAVRRARVVEV